MKKILTEMSLAIIPISNNIFAIIGSNSFTLYDSTTQTIILKSPTMRYMSTVMCNESQSAWLAVDTSGRVNVFNETMSKTKTKIVSDAGKRHWFSIEHSFYCVDAANNLICLNECGEKVGTVFFDKPIDCVYKQGDKVYVNVLTRNSEIDPLDVTSEIYECLFCGEQLESVKIIYKDNGFVDDIKQDTINHKSTSVFLDKDNGKGRKKELVIFPKDDFKTYVKLDFSEIEPEIKKNGILYNYSTNVHSNLVAFLFWDEIVVWDYEKQTVIYRESIDDGSDVVWTSDDKLLIASCSGLFEIKL